MTSEEGSRLDVDKNDGSFKFAITLILFIITFFDRVYVFTGNNAIKAGSIEAIITYLACSLFFQPLIFMIVFILVKALSLEVDSNNKEKLNSFASVCYKVGFISGIGFFIFFVLLVMCYTVSFNLINIPLSSPLNIVIIFLAIFITVVIPSIGSLILTKIYKQYKYNNESNTHTFIVALIAVIFIFVFGMVITQYMFHGNISVKMNDIYNKQDKLIPIEFKITGVQNKNVVVSLYKRDFNSNLSLIDNLEMNTTSNSDKVFSKMYLMVINLDDGDYKIYIDCTNLTEGYYKVSVSTDSLNPLYMKSKTNGFYLRS